MGYTKQNFEDGQVLKAEHLNKMEAGIGEANDTLDALMADGGVGSEEKKKLLPTDTDQPNLTYSGGLVGLEMVDYREGRRLALPELPKPNFNEINILLARGWSKEDQTQIRYEFTYTNNNGMFDHGVLNFMVDADYTAVWERTMPALMSDSNYGFDAIVYVYETTQDTAGMGFRLEKGWYLGNTSTFAFKPIDITKFLFWFPEEDGLHDIEYDNEEARQYLYECFPLTETVRFRVTEDHILVSDNVTVVSYNRSIIDAWRNPYNTELEAVIGDALGSYYMTASYAGGSLNLAKTGNEVYEVTTVPISPKYIPAETADIVAEQLIASGQLGGEKTERATATKQQTGNFPPNTRSIAGMTATYTLPNNGYYFLHDPKENLDEDYFVQFGEGDTEWYFANNTNGGMLSKRFFGIGGNISMVCPSFAWNYPNFTNLAYAYEDTSDNLGMGVTISKGWYAMNATTFELTPFNLKDNPVIIPSFSELTIAGGEAECLDFIKSNWFELEKERTLVIEEKYINGTGLFAADMTKIDPEAFDVVDMLRIVSLLAICGVHATTDDGYLRFDVEQSNCEKVTISWKIPAYIEPKYLPEGGVGYSEDARVTVVKPQTVEAVTIKETYGSGTATYHMARAIASAPIAKGDKLTVIWDGAEYKATAHATTDFGDAFVRFPGIIFGVLAGDLDVPITVNYNPDSTELLIVVDEPMLGDHTIAIYKDAEIVHPIDPKYIPEEAANMVGERLSAKGQVGGEDIIERIELSASRQTVATTRDIVGATITEHVEGRRKFVLPKQRPKASGEVGTEFRTTESGSRAFLGMLYGTYEGYLAKPCFLFTGELLYTMGCPFFWEKGCLETYDSLLYAYEDTPDALGLGLTFTKGWHALSSTTFANKPLDEDECPIFIFDAMGEFNAGVYEGKPLFEACFQPYETAEFKVKPENKLPLSSGDYQIINADVSGIEEIEPFFSTTANFVAPVRWDEHSVNIEPDIGSYGASTANSTATIIWSEPKPIDRKYTSSIIDLSTFMCESDIGTLTINDTLLAHLELMVGTGTTFNKIEAKDVDGKLKAACEAVTGKNIQLCFDLNGAKIYMPTMHSVDPTDDGGKTIGQMAATMLFTLPGAVVDAAMSMVFYTNTNDIDIYFKAQPIG